MPKGISARAMRVFLERIATGDTFAQAALAAGHNNPGAFYRRANPQQLNYDQVFAEALGDALEERAALRADRVDTKVDDWVDDPDCPPAIRQMWAKRWNPAGTGRRSRTRNPI